MNIAVLIFTVTVLVVLLPIGFFYLFWNRWSRTAKEAGYPSLGAYLRAVPRTDQEKREAVDIALKGLVICLLGLMVPPLLVIGLFPLFFGARKMIYASMGLGLVDDAD